MKESPGNAVNGHCSCSAAKVWLANIPAGMGGDVQVCSGCKTQLGFNMSRCHLQPKALSLPCKPGCWKHIWNCAQHWERIPSRAQVLEEALWMENGISGTAIQC